MEKDQIQSYEDLREFLQNWVNAGDNEGTYDVIGMFYLLKACLGNLERHSIPVDFEDIEDLFSDGELEVMRNILKYAK